MHARICISGDAHVVGEMRMRVMSRSYRHQSSAVVAPPKARSAERIREEGQGRGRTPRAGSVSSAAAVGGGCLQSERMQGGSLVAHLLGLRERLALVRAPCRLDLGRRTREQLGRLLLRTPLSLRRLLGEPRERRLGLRLEPTPAPR